MAINYQHAKTIEERLKEENIERLTDDIPADATLIYFYLSLFEAKYEHLDVILANATNTFDIANVLRAIVSGKNEEVISKLLMNLLLPMYVDNVWKTLQSANVDIGISRDTLEFHVKAASKNGFPDIAPTLAICECPITLQQAIESLLSYNDNDLSRFLLFIRETYATDDDDDIISA